MLNGHADDAALVVEIKINVLIQFLRFNGCSGGKLHQRSICIFKIFNAHGFLLLKTSVEKGVVNSFAIFKKNNTQSNSTVRLLFFLQRVTNNVFDPFILYDSTIGELSRVTKILHCLHSIFLSIQEKLYPRKPEALITDHWLTCLLPTSSNTSTVHR